MRLSLGDRTRLHAITAVAAFVSIASCRFAICDELLGRRDNSSSVIISCTPQNDVLLALTAGGATVDRYDSPAEAVRRANPNSAVLLLADKYPTSGVQISSDVLAKANEKALRLYVEYPESFPGIELSPPQSVHWERVVVASTNLDLGLPPMSILSLHDCRFRPTAANDPALVLARVAGFKTAVYGLPPKFFPVLFKTADGTLVATTKLSHFTTARYAPTSEWQTIWEHILAELDPSGTPHRLLVEPPVRPTFSKTELVPKKAEARAVARMAKWLKVSRLLIPAEREAMIHTQLRAGEEETSPPAADESVGDGSHGILEGFASRIGPDGGQTRRLVIRADCQAESAAVLALHASLVGDEESRRIGENLLDFLYFNSELQQGIRADSSHPAFGLIAWGAIAPSWQIATYGDDNARTLLATIVAAGMLKSPKWDASVLKAVAANLRTTGRLGFRGDRIDVPQLEQQGWKHFHEQEIVNYSPPFEAYLWACNLWAFSRTGDRDFLDRTKNAIRMTMEAYPGSWRWGDTMERGRILLPLAWLVRVEDTPEHRGWLKRIADDLLADQQACGAIAERLRGKGAGHFVVPASNDAYGTSETPLIQNNGDPVSDQLYTSGFVLLGLHEAAAATGDHELQRTANKLADYLVRIQVRSDRIPYLDGTWFRAFDFKQWDYWASSADMGWGAWSAEAGWGPAWNAIVLGLRAKDTSMWDVAASMKAERHWPTVKKLMAN